MRALCAFIGHFVIQATQTHNTYYLYVTFSDVCSNVMGSLEAYLNCVKVFTSDPEILISAIFCFITDNSATLTCEELVGVVIKVDTSLLRSLADPRKNSQT